VADVDRDVRRLPPGRHGLPRDYVVEHQRERILTAVAEVVSGTGYRDMTVESVISCAGVSRKTFYQHFDNRETAFLAAYDGFASRVLDQVRQAQAIEGGFTARVVHTIHAVLELLAAHPAETYLCVVEALAVGPAGAKRRADAMRLLVTSVHDMTCALAIARGKKPPPEITAEVVVGGVFEVIYNRVLRGEIRSLPSLLPDLVYCALLPYVGAASAATAHRRLKAAAADDPGADPG
jgi:AcrR family transcriptional regulator